MTTEEKQQRIDAAERALTDHVVNRGEGGLWTLEWHEEKQLLIDAVQDARAAE